MEYRYDANSLITGFSLRHMIFDSRHFCDGSAGKIHNSFGYVVRGTTCITTTDITLELREGSFFFLPEGIRYRSNWNGMPKIEYYMLHMTWSDAEKMQFLPKEIPELSGPETLGILRRMEDLLNFGDERNCFEAMSLLNHLHTLALPYLVRAKKGRDTVLTRAIAYIKNNLSDDFKMSDLARHCYVSESHLYHLFHDELNSSPLKIRNELRVMKAMTMIKNGETDLHEILAETGFSSASYFRKVFVEQAGMTMQQYRKIVRD
ncbi:MAG: helix-turn-helix transcriptional regulator [Clostridia bacterium]|nr:helix-turn-helix transcriptional regulator [Clostridia bacterium]